MTVARKPWMDRADLPRRTSCFDVLVVGSGVAGMSAALELSHVAPEYRVGLLTRDRVGAHGASPLAQGGIAVALHPQDSPAFHARDTELAADGLSRRELIDVLTHEGPSRVQQLVELGARFDRDPSGELNLGLEGAHSRRRIVHADGDRTGAEVTRTLREAVLGAPSIRILEGLRALDLVRSDGRVTGVWVEADNGSLRLYRACEIVLATGGPGRVYLRTTAPPGLDGDGMAMALRAGARLRDVEFVQFHPTALNVPSDPLPLVTEALRGAGARLVDGRGRSVVDPQDGGELASRDRVARVLWSRIQNGQDVFLDAREVYGAASGERFPGVRRVCELHGIDPAHDLIPVTPAAHYHMGGVAVDRDGRTSLEGLWAVGEAAASGLHGANRLASNSLLEGLVFGARVAQSIAGETLSEPLGDGVSRVEAPSESPPPRATRSDPLDQTARHRVRTILSNHVGVVRDATGLSSAVEQLDDIQREIESTTGASSSLLLNARVIARAALLRGESIGSHYRSDGTGERVMSRHTVATLPEGEGGPIVVEFERESPDARNLSESTELDAQIGSRFQAASAF